MKRIILVTAFVVGTVLYVLSAAWAYDYMDVYVNPTIEAEVRDQVKRGYIETDHTSFYTSPREETLDEKLYDKNLGTTGARDYYYALSVMVSSDSHV